MSTSLSEDSTSGNVSHTHTIVMPTAHRTDIDLDVPENHPPTMYDLVANVIHESAAGTTRDKESTVWKVHLRAGSGGGETEKWFQIQDLIVEEIRKEMIFLGETIIQVSIQEVHIIS